jgi:pilus assembly protein CpaB
MNRNRLLIGLALAVVLALFLSIFVYNEFRKAATSQPAVKMNQIVVAAQDIPLGTRLEPSKVKLIPYPAGDSVAGSFTRLEDVTNRAVMTNVSENELILENKLAPTEGGAGLQATIPEGMRAVSVSVNDVVAVAGFVVPGAKVDVLVTGSASGTGGSSLVTRTILQNVKVIAAGQKIEQDREGKPQTVPVITLLVSPEDATKLTLGATQGKIQLSLRNMIDSNNETNPPTVSESQLFGGPAPAEPVRHLAAAPKPVVALAPPPYTVEVITGTKRENKSFPNP